MKVKNHSEEMRKTTIMPKRLDIWYLLSKNVNWILTHLLRIQTKYRSSVLHKLSFMIKIKGGKRIFESHNDATKTFLQSQLYSDASTVSKAKNSKSQIIGNFGPNNKKPLD